MKIELEAATTSRSTVAARRSSRRCVRAACGSSGRPRGAAASLHVTRRSIVPSWLPSFAPLAAALDVEDRC